MTVAVIYGGTRECGNTEILTEQAVQNISVEKIYLKNYQISPIKDQRHTEGGFQDLNDDYNYILERILCHDILIFATPIYWFSMSGTMKLFIDRWSQTLKDPKYPYFKAAMSSKKAYVIAVGGDQPFLKGLPLIQQFQFIFNFIGMSFEGYVLGKGNKPNEIVQDREAIVAASQIQKTLIRQLETNRRYENGF
ncbi:flavodoxin family protein [Virgibacillus dakarensis]|uniref:NAD(P)H-dependent FMN-containing oxidoreductase YwqN n=1 Tax=Lentibacillus populi TaxID=1827502 RepID=A0A9W5U2E9_9BACI|nr:MULTISPECIES: flavodoxin family protein [Bacillaceae]MBT2218497.1 flavodoxin family protein [Virgibacillus dakarensis]MTW86685.1 flavodoxin family protein [Virgibacillus dakarensis]GGB62611.1 putative NAD(P)H-dependent FMN-containing oxidoreductase YwqN [Lentibacillus populi]